MLEAFMPFAVYFIKISLTELCHTHHDMIPSFRVILSEFPDERYRAEN